MTAFPRMRTVSEKHSQLCTGLFDVVLLRSYIIVICTYICTYMHLTVVRYNKNYWKQLQFNYYPWLKRLYLNYTCKLIFQMQKNTFPFHLSREFCWQRISRCNVWSSCWMRETRVRMPTLPATRGKPSRLRTVSGITQPTIIYPSLFFTIKL